MNQIAQRKPSPAVILLLDILNDVVSKDDTMPNTTIHSGQASKYDETTFYTVTINGEPAKRAVRMSNMEIPDATAPNGTQPDMGQVVVFETFGLKPGEFSTSLTRRYWLPTFFEPRYTAPQIVNGFPDPSTIVQVKRIHVGDLNYEAMPLDVLNFLKDGTLPN